VIFMRPWPVLATVLVAGFPTSSCATLVGRESATPTEPTLVIKADPKNAKGPRCVTFGEVERKRGAVPDDVEVLARITVTPNRPVSLRLIEDALAEWSANHCAEGFHVQSAAAAVGAAGILEVKAVGWTRRAAAKPDVPSASTSEAAAAPPEGEAEFWE